MTHHAKRNKTRSLRGTDRAAQASLTPEHEAFYQAIMTIYEPKNQDMISLMVSVAAELRRYDLGRSCTTASVINEAVVRGIAAINKGKSIPVPIAWIRLTCRYIIKEESREKRRRRVQEAQTEIIERIPDSWTEPEWLSDDELSPKHQQIQQSFQQLSRLDQDILTLNIVEGLQWKIVQDRLVAMGYQQCSLGALRQRKHRAIQQLKADLSLD